MKKKEEIVEVGKIVGIVYNLRLLNSEEILEFAPEDVPFEYLHGAENIVPGLEEVLVGKTVGFEITVELPPEKAYGYYEEGDREVFSKNEIPDSENLKETWIVVLEDEDGYEFEALVWAVTEDTIELDFNPPFAGMTIVYDVKIVSVRQATDEELENGFPNSYYNEENDKEGTNSGVEYNS